MKRTLLFPICIILIAILIRVFESSDSSQNTKNSQNTTEIKQPKVIAPTNKAYYIKIKDHSISQKNAQVVFRANLESNFPKDTYLQTQFLYITPLGKALLSQKPCDMEQMKMEYGPFPNSRLLPGKFEIVVFYSPSSTAPQELQKVSFTENSYHFTYGDTQEYTKIYKTRYESAQKLLSNVYALYSVAKKKYRYFKQENLGAGEWHIWQDKWLKSFEFTQGQEREYYESGYIVALFPSMKKSIGLLNIVEDLVTVDYLKAIEARKEIAPYREARFEELFYRIKRNLEYESIALTNDPQQKLAAAYAQFAQKCSQFKASTTEPTVVHRENFLFCMLELKKKYTQLQKVQKNHFVKYSNELLLDIKKMFFDNAQLFDNTLHKDFVALNLAFLNEWYQKAIEFDTVKTKPSSIPQISLEKTSQHSIDKWNLQKIPLKSMQQIFRDLYSQIKDLQSKINENGNLLLEVNNLIIWQSELAKRQEKNQKLLKIDSSPKMQELITEYARFSMEILIFMEEAKQEQDEKVLLKTINDLEQRIKQFSQETVMFYMLFKTILFIFRLIDFVLITIFVFLISLLPKFLIKPFMPRLFRLFCWSFIRFLGKSPHIHENFTPPLPKQYILISNHPSGYDLLMINALFSVKPLAQSGVRKWFLVGRIAEATGTVFVDREKKDSRNAAKEACLKALEKGHSVLIYPEGGCYGRDLTPFKLGAFDISHRTGIPILPVYLQYEAENAYEWGWEDNLPQHLFKLITAINKHTHCHIFSPIYPQNFSDAKSYQEYVFSLYKNWQQRFKLIDNEESETVSYTGTALHNS